MNHKVWESMSFNETSILNYINTFCYRRICFFLGGVADPQSCWDSFIPGSRTFTPRPFFHQVYFLLLLDSGRHAHHAGGSHPSATDGRKCVLFKSGC